MGFFTWTDARHEPRLTKNGGYHTKDMIGYDCFAKIVCPDNTEIIEKYYEGYGMFDGKDVYDLVVDWNRAHLTSIFDKLAAEKPNHWGCYLRQLAAYYQSGDEKAFNAELTHLAGNEDLPFIRNEWKRTIGITIACGDQNSTLPYPIKITSMKQHKKYNELVPSHVCQ